MNEYQYFCFITGKIDNLETQQDYKKAIELYDQSLKDPAGKFTRKKELKARSLTLDLVIENNGQMACYFNPKIS